MSRTDISGSLKDSGRAISGPRTRTQSTLVMGEMAMALVLLVGAGLMCRTLVQLWKVDPGFDPSNVSLFAVTPPPSLRNQSSDAIHAALRQISATLHSVPGVEAVSLHYGAVPMEYDSERGFLLEGQEPPTQRTENIQQALEYTIEPGYLNTMRIPLLRGRFLSDEDHENAARVVVIDASFAQRYFAGQGPIGKPIRIFEFDSDSNLQIFTNRYIGGRDPYLQVLTAQTIALQNERNDVDILRRRMDASVLLIKALGGGWTVSELPKTGGLRQKRSALD